MLSKMFPKAGQTVPEICLEGFEGEWEEKQFSKLVKRVTKSSDFDSLPKVEFEDIISGQGRLNKDISSKLIIVKVYTLNLDTHYMGNYVHI